MINIGVFYVLFSLNFIVGLISEVELGAQSVIYELATIMNMVLTV